MKLKKDYIYLINIDGCDKCINLPICICTYKKESDEIDFNYSSWNKSPTDDPIKDVFAYIEKINKILGPVPPKKIVLSQDQHRHLIIASSPIRRRFQKMLGRAFQDMAEKAVFYPRDIEEAIKRLKTINIPEKPYVVLNIDGNPTIPMSNFKNDIFRL